MRLALSVLLAVLGGCGPNVSNDLEESDVIGTYVRGTVGSNGRFYLRGVNTLGGISIREDGEAAYFSQGCVGQGGDWAEPELEWKVSGQEIVLIDTSENETYAHLRIAADPCGEHELWFPGSNSSSSVTAGKFCPTDVKDQGHTGYECDLVPCDDVARECWGVDEDE